VAARDDLDCIAAKIAAALDRGCPHLGEYGADPGSDHMAARRAPLAACPTAIR
jgi:hypothetical protein